MCPKRQRRIILRRAGLVLTGALLLSCAWWDARLKAGPVSGDAPRALWHAHVNDVAGTLAAFKDSARGAAILQELSPLTRQAALDFRIALGVRPTPARWRRWFGNELRACGRGKDWAISVRPGLLARCADFIFGASAGGEVRKLRGAYYVWRGGTLIVSPSQAYLLKVIPTRRNAPPFEPPAPKEGVLVWREGLDVQSSALREHVWISFGTHWRLDGHLNFKGAPGAVTPHALTAWPSKPLLAVQGGRLKDWTALAGAVAGRPLLELLPQAYAETWDVLRTQWQIDEGALSYFKESDGFSGALLDIGMRGTLPVPAFAMSLTYDAELDALPFPPPQERIPHAWGETEGFLWPFLGEAFLIAAAPSGPRYIFTSQEPLMAPMLEAAAEAEPLSGTAWLLDADLAGLAERAETLLIRAAEHELLPRRNARDVENDILPALRALALVGDLRLEITPDAEGYAFTGGFVGKREAQ